MKSIEKIYALLASSPGKRRAQIAIAKKCKCSKAFVSKTCKRLLGKGIIARPYKNQLVVVNFTGLLNEWVKTRALPSPIFIEAKIPKEQIIKKLEPLDGYALTLFSAAWIRTKYFQTNSIELYVEQDKLGKFVKTFGKKSGSKTDFMVFPVDEIFLKAEKQNSLRLIPAVQNYVDLMAFGGNGNRIALKLADKLGWFE